MRTKVQNNTRKLINIFVKYVTEVEINFIFEVIYSSIASQVDVSVACSTGERERC